MILLEKASSDGATNSIGASTLSLASVVVVGEEGATSISGVADEERDDDEDNGDEVEAEEEEAEAEDGESATPDDEVEAEEAEAEDGEPATPGN